MDITPDTMLVILQALPFFTAVAGLHFILFKPMLSYLQARREATVGERQAAEALREKAGRKMQQWDVALTRAHAEVADFRAQKRAEAQAAHARQVAAARAEAERHIDDQLEVLQGEAALAREQIGRMARSLAGEMAARALGRSLGAVEA
jgi:F0F1-type ATP synthase membrane subunit b/b'